MKIARIKIGKDYTIIDYHYIPGELPDVPEDRIDGYQIIIEGHDILPGGTEGDHSRRTTHSNIDLGGAENEAAWLGKQYKDTFAEEEGESILRVFIPNIAPYDPGFNVDGLGGSDDEGGMDDEGW